MTLIDKAEALATLRKHANGKTVLGGQVYQSLTLETALEAIAALPARGVGVPTVDELANIIRTVDGQNMLGAGALAEAILAALTTEASQ